MNDDDQQDRNVQYPPVLTWEDVEQGKVGQLNLPVLPETPVLAG
jgi:hypothetical protein